MSANQIEEFLDRNNTFAVVGASRDPEKYGYRVYKDLKEGGYSVYPVNPNADEILGDRCYPSLDSLPVKPEVVDVVIPPKITEQVVRNCRELGIQRVWMQPGSESQAAIDFCEQNGIAVIHSVCVMVERRKKTG